MSVQHPSSPMPATPQPHSTSKPPGGGQAPLLAKPFPAGGASSDEPQLSCESLSDLDSAILASLDDSPTVSPAQTIPAKGAAALPAPLIAGQTRDTTSPSAGVSMADRPKTSWTQTAPTITSDTARPPDSKSPTAEPKTLAKRQLQPGEKVHKYVILRELGRGGMGVVYEAEDPLLARRVALKILSETVVDEPATLKKFLAEAKAAGKLYHPNAVAVYDVNTLPDGTCYLVMELVRGRSMSDRVKQSGPLDWVEATRVVIDASRGLDAAHHVGLVHRDIKPANIMLADDGTVKLADFGLAKQQAKVGESLSSVDKVVGTPQYMSPEQCQAEACDARSDIYSMGATYYNLLTGQPPFGRHSSAVQLMFAHCTAPIPNPCEVRPELPPECAHIIARAMAKAPDDRYRTAFLFHSDLEALLAQYGHQLHMPSSSAVATSAPLTGSPTNMLVRSGSSQAIGQVRSGIMPPMNANRPGSAPVSSGYGPPLTSSGSVMGVQVFGGQPTAYPGASHFASVHMAAQANAHMAGAHHLPGTTSGTGISAMPAAGYHNPSLTPQTFNASSGFGMTAIRSVGGSSGSGAAVPTLGSTAARRGYAPRSGTSQTTLALIVVAAVLSLVAIGLAVYLVMRPSGADNTNAKNDSPSQQTNDGDPSDDRVQFD